ncbi:MAG: AAA family ATPase [Gammaproteobacteria bacterium]|nr:AAA family ATPase [Gammaproteobacteria bacterium]
MNPEEFLQLVDGLRTPGAYSHPVSGVEVIETHISGVLLAGDYAYKIKKPVDFGFVDFSTLEKRRHYCEEELRLNRRFSPDLYLDVVGIHGTRRAPRVGGDGPAFEYAVRMKRFDQDALLDRCVGNGDLVTASMIEAFARSVAGVHGDAATATSSDGFGSAETIVANVRECWDPIRAAGIPEHAGVRRLAAHMDALGGALHEEFQKRLRAGRVRECHGDLHLGNLYLSDGAIRAFDCIEFNPSLRWIDVANEIAFTIMDLRYHGEAGLARRFRNAYLDASGDYAMLRVLIYYEIYRALVRAKVAALRESEQAGAGLEDAGSHLELALGLMNTAPRPALIITCGLSGAGKTHASSELISCSEAVRIRSDVERNRNAGGAGNRYSETDIERVYERLLAEAEEIMDAGHPVIVDATFLRRARRGQFRALAERRGVPFRIFHCVAPEAVLRQRIRRRIVRGADESEADLAVLDRQLNEMELPGEDEKPWVVAYDTESPPLLGSVMHALALAVDRSP